VPGQSRAARSARVPRPRSRLPAGAAFDARSSPLGGAAGSTGEPYSRREPTEGDRGSRGSRERDAPPARGANGGFRGARQGFCRVPRRRGLGCGLLQAGCLDQAHSRPGSDTRYAIPTSRGRSSRPRIKARYRRRENPLMPPSCRHTPPVRALRSPIYGVPRVDPTRLSR
jgi:hypothetical protein